MSKMLYTPSLTKGKKFGYCMGIYSESLLYNMYYTYYMYFLTDIAQLRPGLAAVVSLISIAWDAITDPIIGYYADREGQDKRKYMARAAFPMALLFIGTFFNIGTGSSDAVKMIYYIAVTMLFWLAYTVYTIPYYAVVAEITEDYNERTDIRGLSSLLNTGSIFLGNALPAILPTAFIGIGISENRGWTVTAAILAVAAVVLALVAVRCLKDVKLKKAEGDTATRQKGSTMFKAYLEIIKIKPFRWFTVFVFFFLIASSMIQANIMYVIEGRLGLDSDTYMTLVIIVLVASMAVFVPIVTKIAEKKDRRFAGIVSFSAMFVVLIALKLIGVNSIPMLIVMTVAMAMGLACFWTIFYAMAYDLVEIDEFITGERRESIITAFPQFFQKFGAAIGLWLVGTVLEICGYKEGAAAADQLASAKTGIENLSSIIPAAFLIISIIGLVMYPVTKERFTLLQSRLAEKREKGKANTSGLEKLL